MRGARDLEERGEPLFIRQDETEVADKLTCRQRNVGIRVVANVGGGAQLGLGLRAEIIADNLGKELHEDNGGRDRA